MRTQHDTGEGSSSGAKRQNPAQVLAMQSEQPLQVSSEDVTSSICRIDKCLHHGEGDSHGDSKAGGDVVTKKPVTQSDPGSVSDSVVTESPTAAVVFPNDVDRSCPEN